MRTRATLVLAMTLLASGCIPTTSAYLRVPVETTNGGHAEATVHVPLEKLARRMSGFTPEQVAFYHEGRSPVPHELIDADGDGEPELAQLSIPVAGDGSTRLIAVCPAAENGRREGPARDPEPEVTLRFDRAQR